LIVKVGRVFEFRPCIRIVTGDDLRAGTPGDLVQFLRTERAVRPEGQLAS
jgi:hypothetical protein